MPDVSLSTTSANIDESIVPQLWEYVGWSWKRILCFYGWKKVWVMVGWSVDVGFLVGGGWWLRDETSKLSGVALTKQTNKRGRAKERETQIFWHHSALYHLWTNFYHTYYNKYRYSTHGTTTVQHPYVQPVLATVKLRAKYNPVRKCKYPPGTWGWWNGEVETLD